MFEWINDTPYTCVLLMVIQGWLKRQRWHYCGDGWVLIESQNCQARYCWPHWLIRAECRWWNSRLGVVIRWACGSQQREYRLHQLERKKYWAEAYRTLYDDCARYIK